MFRREYHCFVAGLPDLLFDEGKITQTLETFRQELKEELHPADYRLVHMVFLPYDHQNLIRFLKDGSDDFDVLGNYAPEDFAAEVQNLDAIIPEPSRIEPYLASLIRRWYDENTDRSQLDPERMLLEGYYAMMAEAPNDFLLKWSAFDLTLRNIVTAVNCRRFGREIAPELIGDNPVNSQLVRNPARDFGLASELDQIEKILQICELPDLLEREKKLDWLRWEFIDEAVFFHYFDIEKILGYLLRLMIALRWFRLERPAGESLFRDLLEKMEKSYQLPDEFHRKK